MSTIRYTFNKVVQDPDQLDLFLITHMGDPFLRSEVEGAVTHVYTSEQDSSTTTQQIISNHFDRYPDPPRSARGPASTVVVEVTKGGTGRTMIPSGSIVFGMDGAPLSADSSLVFDPVTKTLGVLNIS
jgi:hypothetical protein